jgi:hypothetical protein
MNSDSWELGESSSESVGAGESGERDQFFDSETQADEIKDETEYADAKDEDKVDEDQEESDEAYRRRVYENTYAVDASNEPGRALVRRLYCKLSHRMERCSSQVSENLSDTPPWVSGSGISSWCCFSGIRNPAAEKSHLPSVGVCAAQGRANESFVRKADRDAQL